MPHARTHVTSRGLFLYPPATETPKKPEGNVETEQQTQKKKKRYAYVDAYVDLKKKNGRREAVRGFTASTKLKVGVDYIY